VPNNSEAINDTGMAAQFTLTNAREDRRDRWWIARAIIFLPVPVSPVSRTVESVGATFVTRDSTALKAADAPTTSSNIDAWAISSFSAIFSLCRAVFQACDFLERILQRIRACTCSVTSIAVPRNP